MASSMFCLATVLPRNTCSSRAYPALQIIVAYVSSACSHCSRRILWNLRKRTKRIYHPTIAEL